MKYFLVCSIIIIRSKRIIDPILKYLGGILIMRNFKRTLALVLAVIMVVGTFATVSAASTSNWYDKAVEALDDAGISNIGKTAAEPLTRNEFVMWIAKIESLQLSEDAWNDEIASVVFTDVTEAHHRAAIAYSYKANFIIGNGDGTFAPDKTLSLAEASAVIVRLMRYESKVTGLADEWDINYMRAASIYCKAFDQVFYKNSNTYDPDYQLTKGETAYILATILNFINRDEDDLIKTADGIDLGSRFEGMTPAAKEDVYYIANLDRVSAGTAITNTGVSEDAAEKVAGNRVERLTNVIDVTKEVKLYSADGEKVIVVSGAEFVKALRVELGMEPTPDFMNEEAEINVFNYINVGTLVDVKLADSVVFVNGTAYVNNYKEIASLNVNSNSVVVDTYLQYSLSNDEKFVGYAAAALGNNGAVTNWKPVLNTSYDATMATSWTNIVKDATTGAVTSAKLNFKGVAYEYGVDANGEIVGDIKIYDKTWTPMPVDVAVKTLINAAQGECYAVFNDVDADGLYDTVYVEGSAPFAYATKANAQPTDNGTKYKYDYLTSISEGVVEGNAYSAWNNMGAVIYNREVGYPNSGGMMSSDAYNLTAKATGKLQLVLCSPNSRPTWAGEKQENCVPLYYTIVDLASFYTGIIQEVSADKVDGYYTARILCTDDVVRTVYIPYEATKTVKLDVTLGGATAEYTFDSSAWFTFIEDTKKAATENGIVNAGTVKEEDYLTWTAAWMAGKYVEFALNEENEAICILGTDSKTSTTGFVTGVEKTETGDNTYNVTIAATSAVNYANSTKYFEAFTYYFNATNPLTYSKIFDSFYGKQHTYQPNFGGDKLLTDADTGAYITVVGDDGVTYYQTNGATSQLWASSTDLTNANTYYVVLDPATGKIYKDANGNFADKNGKVFIDTEAVAAYNSVNAIKTVEVRAAASGIFDWANYNVYNQLFVEGSLIDPNVGTDTKKVNAGTDLIYVTVGQDAGSNYILYNAIPSTLVNAAGASRTTQFQVNGKDYTAGRWYKIIASKIEATAEGSWFDILDGYIIDYTKVEDLADGVHANGVKYKQALYNMTVGYGAYYERAYDASKKTFTYEIGFTTVKTLTGVIGTQDAVVDTVNSLLVPIYKYTTGSASVHLQLTTEADIAKYEAMGYFVDENGYVFRLEANTQSIVYKKDAKGNDLYKDVVYDETKATESDVKENVLFKTIVDEEGEQKVYPYEVLSVAAKTNKDDGYFPGAYYLTIDGVKYSVTANTPVVVVTPSADGFDIAVKTVAQISSEGAYFVTEWNSVIGTGNTLETLAIVGQKAGATKAPSTTEPSVEAKQTLVYLDGTASAVIKHDKYSNEYLVVSDKSAYALPTGEEVGAIYRSYPTYIDADNAIKIDLGIKGGAWYIVDENNKIVSDTEIELLEGTITSVKADGTTIATLNGVKNQNITSMKTEFFYFNAEKTLLNIAGDNTNVTVISSAAFGDLFKTQVKAVEDAQKAYDEATKKYEAGNLSDERYDYYKTNLENAEKALVEAKAANLDKYFNGQFWGFANSPLYRYVAMAQGTYQEGNPTLTFNYVVVEDTLCVFSDSFSFAG